MLSKEKKIRGWVVVSKSDDVMTFAFGVTRRRAQEALTFVWEGTTSLDKWNEYAQKGFRTIRATLTVDAEKGAK